MTLIRTYILKLLLAGSILLGIGSEAAHAQFSVAAGANFDRLSDIEGNFRATFDNATGFHVGVFYDMGLGPINLRPGLFYVDAGSFDTDFGDGFDSIDLTLIEIPIDVRLETTTPVVRPYVLAGPVFRFASSDDEAFDESLKALSFAGNVGVGIGIDLGSLTLFPELRYAFGVGSLVEDFEFLGASFTSDDDQRLSMFMLRLGVTF